MRIALEITSRCNMACAMCGHPSITREKADMTWNRFTRLVSEIQSAGHSLRSIQWFGEPLLAENFVAAVSHLAREGVAVTNAFYTNAMLLIPEMTDRLADVGFAKVFGQTNKVWLSVDSMDPEVYSQIRCGGDFETVASNTQYFCDMLADSLIGVGVQRMITRLNPDEPEEPFERFGVPVFTRYAGRHCDKARDLTVKPFHRDRRPECREMWDTLYIAQDGRATSCCIDANLEHCIGSTDDMSMESLGQLRTVQQAAFSEHDYRELAMCQRCTGMEMQADV